MILKQGYNQVILMGIVTDAEGNPLPEVYVSLQSKIIPPPTSITTEDGLFYLGLDKESLKERIELKLVHWNTIEIFSFNISDIRWDKGQGP